MATVTTQLFPWSDTLSMKIGIIDTQHKHLVGLINDLHQAMVDGQEKEQAGKILSTLIKYAQVHFKTEEGLMYTYTYPDYGSHRFEHEHLTATVLDFLDKYQRGEVGITIEVMEFLKNWLYKHILESDKRYSHYLNSQGVR